MSDTGNLSLLRAPLGDVSSTHSSVFVTPIAYVVWSIVGTVAGAMAVGQLPQSLALLHAFSSQMSHLMPTTW